MSVCYLFDQIIQTYTGCSSCSYDYCDEMALVDVIAMAREDLEKPAIAETGEDGNSRSAVEPAE